MIKVDALQRYLAAASTIQGILTPGGVVLDVGGGSGDLTRYLPGYSVVIADVDTGSGHLTVRADGAVLPFVDGAVDIALSLDALEHVKPQRRPAFLRELTRVARKAVVLTAPFDTPGVDAADRAVASSYQERLGQEHPWLCEHLAHERPSLDETLSALGPETGCLPLGNLAMWCRLQLMDIHLSTVPRGAQLASALDEAYAGTLASRDRLTPCYRHLLVARVDGVSDVHLPTASPHSVLEGMIDFEVRIATLMHDAATRDGTGDSSGDPATVALLETYRQAVAGWEHAYIETLQSAERAHRWKTEFLGRRSVRLLRGILRVFGGDL